MAISVRRATVQVTAAAVAGLLLVGCTAKPDGPKDDVAPTRAAPTHMLSPEATEPKQGLPAGVIAPSPDQRVGAALGADGTITIVTQAPANAPVKVAKVGAQGQLVRIVLFQDGENSKALVPFTSSVKVPAGVDVNKKINIVFTGLPNYGGNSVIRPGKAGDVDWAQVRELP